MLTRIEEYNRRLDMLFHSMDFRAYLISKVKHTPGMPYVHINTETQKAKCDYYVGKYFDDDWVAQREYGSPLDDVEQLCYEYIKMKDPEIYDFISNGK